MEKSQVKWFVVNWLGREGGAVGGGSGGGVGWWGVKLQWRGRGVLAGQSLVVPCWGGSGDRDSKTSHTCMAPPPPILAYKHKHINLHTHTHTHTHTHMRAWHTQRHTWTHTHTHTHTCICAWHKQIDTQTHTHTYARTHACMHSHVHTHTHPHTHTHSCTHSNEQSLPFELCRHLFVFFFSSHRPGPGPHPQWLRVPHTEWPASFCGARLSPAYRWVTSGKPIMDGLPQASPGYPRQAQVTPGKPLMRGLPQASLT